jgi:cation diffusion facilitator family transporter
MVLLSFLVNMVLFLVKIYIFVLSGSLSVLASLLDSSIDLLAQAVLMAANRMANRPREAYETLYPAGVSRVEPIGVIVCAVIMSLGALWVMKEAAMDLFQVYVEKAELPKVGLDVGSGIFLGALVALKAVLWVLCTRMATKGDVSLEAVAQDHRNDVASNAIALLAAGLASSWKNLWPVDPAGAIVISLWIIWSWASTAKEQADLLVGKAADPEFLDKVRELAETHDPSVSLDVVRAYHFGPRFLVELEVVMAKETPLGHSHDIGILLQHKIENLEECERCFVHIDYQHRDINDHDPSVPIERKTGGDSPEAAHLTRRTPAGAGEQNPETYYTHS